MSVNIPSNVRSILYLLSVFVNAVFGFLIASDYGLPVLALALLAGFNAVVAIMARANVTPDGEVK